MKNQEHRGKRGEYGVSARPKKWPEGKAEAAVVMAGVQGPTALTATALETT